VKRKELKVTHLLESSVLNISKGTFEDESNSSEESNFSEESNSSEESLSSEEETKARVHYYALLGMVY
jgi:hypothetical protein